MATITVSSGQVQSGVTLIPGDQDQILSGGVSISTFVASSAAQFVSSGGVALATVVAAGGSAAVEGGRLRLAEIESGATLQVMSGGLASQTTIDSGATDYIVGGGEAISSVVAGTEVVSSGGIALATVNSGTQTVAFAGSAIGTTNYGLQTVFGGGVAATTTDFGALQVGLGGEVLSAIVSSGGLLALHEGAGGSGVIVDAGGSAAIGSGAALNATTVNAGGSISVLGGQAAGVLLRSGADATVASGGAISNANVQTGGTLTISGGLAEVVLLSGGTAILTDGASVSRVQIFEGGHEFVGSFSHDQSSLISSGGSQFVGLGGTAVGDVVQSGGIETIMGALSAGQTGGFVSKTTIMSGGKVVLLGAAGVTVPSVDLGSLKLAPGGLIDLTTLAYSTSETVTINNKTDKLTLSPDNGGAATQIQLLGDYADETFFLADDGAGGTLIGLDGPPCYCRGTRIRTDQGEIAVEDLRIGDRLITRDGEARALRWIGRRGYNGAFVAGNRDLLPVTFRAGSLDRGAPVRDLSVSPLHAMYLDGVLIPAVTLVNGHSVIQAAAVDVVEYFHLELDSHDIILAEGVLSESFVDDDSRGMFHNAAEFAVLYPDTPRRAAVYCAPRVQDGPVLEAVRSRIAARINPATLALCRGYLEVATRERIQGWAIDDADATRRVRVVLRDNGVAIGDVLADRPRTDLMQAAVGDGAHGFELAIPGGLSPLAVHVITAEAIDGTALAGEIAIEAAAQIEAPVVSGMPGTYRGHVDLITRERILGWAIDDADPQAAVPVQVLVDGVLAASVLANRHRRDLEQAGIGSGRCALEHHFVPPLSPLARHIVELRCEATGHRLAAPTVLESAGAFDGALEQAIDAAVAGLAHSGAEQRVLNFLEQQAARLRQMHAEAQSGQVARDAAAHCRLAMPVPRALVIDHEYPDAGRDAGSQAILSHMRALGALGYAVSFVAAQQLDRVPPSGLAEAGIEVCAAPFYASVEEVLRRQARGFDAIYLHRMGNAARYLTLARDYQPSARILYGVADLHHLRLARQAAVEDRPELLAESNRVRLAECTAAWQADAVLTHSPVEAAELKRLVPGARVHVVPWAVTPCPTAAPFAARTGVAFLGNYAHGPNVDAARFLVEQVMPLVWQQNPAISCSLVGAAVPATVRALAGPKVSVLGHVADLAQLFAQIRLTVAPLRFGAGIKGKVLDSLAAGIPCIATPVAAEGLALPAELIGADAAVLAETIVRLHTGGAAYDAAVSAGLALVATAFSVAATQAALRSALGGAAMRAAG